MNRKDISIENKLKISFATLGAIIIIVAFISVVQANIMGAQTETIYTHPIQVRSAISTLSTEIANIRTYISDMIISENNQQIAKSKEMIRQSEFIIDKQFVILDELYLGAKEDVNLTEQAYVGWKNALDRTIAMISEGDIASAKMEIEADGDLNKNKIELENSVYVIEQFAINKTDELYSDNRLTNLVLNILVLCAIAFMMVISFVIFRSVYRDINRPLIELGNLFSAVEKGNYSVRSNYEKSDEFGALSMQINQMLNTIESQKELNEKSAVIAGDMLSEDDSKKYFHRLLKSIMGNINGQFGGVYLLSEEKNTYDLFSSIGLDNNYRKTFDKESMEGELGFTASANKINLVSNIPDISSISYASSIGMIKPKQIVTIPIIGERKEIVAFITIGSISVFSNIAMELLNDLWPVINSRTQGVLTYRKMKIIKEEIEAKNAELETQKSELNAQGLELKEQNRELERQKEELSDASMLKTKFLSNMSHELRTPLNSIIALSGVLQRKIKSQISLEEYGFLEVISRSGKNLLDMINDILDISKIESGTVEIENDDVNVNNLISELCDMVKPLTDQKNIKLIHNNSYENILIYSDEKKLRQILQNLLSNGIKFTDVGSVEIGAEKLGKDLIITIKDTGVGIALEHQTQIFEEFQQADSSTTRKYGGTGLGLAISKKYTKMLGGDLQVESIVGTGSIFTLSIPLINSMDNNRDDRNARMAKLKVHQIEERNVKGKGYKLLVIEDSNPAVVQIRDIFEEADFIVEIAEDGEVALKKIANEIPDCIILDLMMPKIDGFQVLKEIRNNKLTMDIPVVILTAKHLTIEEKSELNRNNIFEIIQKGNVDPQKLKNVVIGSFIPATVEIKKEHKIISKTSEKPVILIVEDNPDNMMTARAILNENYSLLEAVNGESAIVMAKSHVPDLILMDIALPDIDGVEVFRILRKDQNLSAVPIIALTASAMTTEREIFLAHGFNAFLAKPIIEDEFIKVIEGVLYGK